MAVRPRRTKVATIVGTRPQFVKAAAVSRMVVSHNAIHPEHMMTEVLVHTGQHYDYEMSAVFFQELGLPEPAYHLGVGSASHGAQTGEMLKRIEAVLMEEQPTLALVYGDTNTTLAGALAAAKLSIPIAHVEAGLRSFNRRMPEEINRILTDHLATWLFCPSEQAEQNLAQEGIRSGVHLVGDVMYDVHLWQAPAATDQPGILAEFGVRTGSYALATVHRAENADDPERLRSIFLGLERLARDGLQVTVPLHPRTRKALQALGISPRRVRVAPAVSYRQMLCLEANARVILTDSGGLQKEAYWFGVPCVTLRDETEWVETVQTGWNVLVGCDPDRIEEAAHRPRPDGGRPSLYGDGRAAAHIMHHLVEASCN